MKNIKNLFSEFKNFAIRGNAVDMMVGIVVGVGFGSLIKSFIDNILMPPIGFLLGKVDFSNLYINLSGKKFSSLSEAMEKGAPVIKYGLFLNDFINFLIIAFVVFLLVREIEKLKQKFSIKKNKEKKIKKCKFCSMEIPKDAKKCPFCTSNL